MISEFEQYHGIALAQLVHGALFGLKVRLYSRTSNAAYVLDDSVGIYLKYSTFRTSPWQFTFHDRHLKELCGLLESMPATFLALICGGDGVALIPEGRFLNQAVLDHDRMVISVRRRKREKYRVNGIGPSELKVSQRSFPADIFERLRVP